MTDEILHSKKVDPDLGPKKGTPVGTSDLQHPDAQALLRLFDMETIKQIDRVTWTETKEDIEIGGERPGLMVVYQEVRGGSVAFSHHAIPMHIADEIAQYGGVELEIDPVDPNAKDSNTGFEDWITSDGACDLAEEMGLNL